MASTTLAENEALNLKFHEGFKRTAKKLQQYYASHDYPQTGRAANYTQHALPLLKAVRALDPRRAPFLSDATEDVKLLPQFGAAECLEYKLFLAQCKEVSESIEIIPYWRSLAPRFPSLTRMALRYLSVPCGSVDAERSFSSRGNILTPQRMNLSKENRARLTFLYTNAKR